MKILENGKTYISKYNEEYSIVDNYVSGGSRKYLIEFTETKFRTQTRKENILDGRVKDWSKTPLHNIVPGDIYKNNSGDEYMVLEVGSGRPRRIKIKFLRTGSIIMSRIDMVYNRKVRDPYSPVYAGVGYMGEISIPHGDKVGRKLYYTWQNIIKRCYDVTRHDYPRYGGKGVSVNSEWHCFKTFIEDVVRINGYSEESLMSGKLNLDKDKLQFHLPMSDRVYSKSTCLWLSPEENRKYISKRSKKGPSTK